MQRGTAVQWLSISLLDSWALDMVQASTTPTGVERVGWGVGGQRLCFLTVRCSPWLEFLWPKCSRISCHYDKRQNVLMASQDPGAECCFLGLTLERSNASDSPQGSCFSEHKGEKVLPFPGYTSLRVAWKKGRDVRV